jgi:CRISPR/Cas system CSM-associated protein Csm3 (group 7 of RAMP superfamily)
LQNGIALGAKTSTGLGKLKLKDGFLFKEFDFKEAKHVIAWLMKDYLKGKDGDANDLFTITNHDFIIEAILEIKNSLIVRSYSNNPQAPDSIHIKSNGENILPGSSIKGALRSRSERILNTLWNSSPDVQLMLDSLFGGFECNVDGEKIQDGYEVASRFGVDEVEIDDVAEELQTRIKIDRFTGGTIEAALFDNMPLFPKKDKEHIKKFRIQIKDAHDCDKGIALLLLKDLWTGTLAIGGERNVGRGVLEGKKAVIIDKSSKIEFADPASISADDLKCFDSWIAALKNYTDKELQTKRLKLHLKAEETLK